MSMPVLLGCTLLLSTTLVATAFSTLPAPSTRSDDRALEAMVATEIQTRLLSRTLHALVRPNPLPEPICLRVLCRPRSAVVRDGERDRGGRCNGPLQSTPS
jgi:hypothetical protein